MTKRPSSALRAPNKVYSDTVYLDTVSRELAVLKPEMVGIYNLHKITNAEYYDVYSVTSVSNATAFMSSGIRTKEAVLNYLRKRDLDYLIEDNSETADTLLRSGVSAVEFINSQNESKYPVRLSPNLIDSLKVRSIKGFKASGVDADVLQGRIAYDDLMALGVTRFNVFPHSNSERLRKIKNGELPYTAQELTQMIDKIIPRSNPKPYKHLLKYALEMADVVGSSVVLELDTPMMVQPYFDTLKKTYADRDKLKASLSYVHDVVAGAKGPVYRDELIQMFDAGVSVELAIRVLDREVTVMQAIALTQGESSSVSSGWL